jgi:hypothetical protein
LNDFEQVLNGLLNAVLGPPGQGGFSSSPQETDRAKSSRNISSRFSPGALTPPALKTKGKAGRTQSLPIGAPPSGHKKTARGLQAVCGCLWVYAVMGRPP